VSELRAPDPTLTAHETVVYVGPGDRAHTSRDCQIADGLGFPISPHHARWFAVPCHECFPEAPPPGAVYVDAAGGVHTDADLDWQTGR
jgi:hypothetical protein